MAVRMKRKSRITSKQKSARRKNMALARKSKKDNKKKIKKSLTGRPQITTSRSGKRTKWTKGVPRPTGPRKRRK